MRRPRDLAEVHLSREFMPDGMGGEVDGIAIRVWVYSEDIENTELALTVLLPEGEHAWHADAREVIENALRIWEMER